MCSFIVSCGWCLLLLLIACLFDCSVCLDCGGSFVWLVVCVHLRLLWLVGVLRVCCGRCALLRLDWLVGCLRALRCGKLACCLSVGLLVVGVCV